MQFADRDSAQMLADDNRVAEEHDAQNMIEKAVAELTPQPN